ncbi:MAG: class I SAM-dependent methyltransferase [Holosporaceae bacterium]|nr:class I SAM-dependent methyltransferase [Holosporaceae bacterium]
MDGSVAKIACKLRSFVADNCTLFIGYGGNILDLLDNGKLYYAIPKTYTNKVPWPKIRPFKTVAIDVDSLPFAEETFKVIFINHYLEFQNTNTKFLNEIFRVLKRDGKMVATVINNRSLNRISKDVRSIKEIIFDINNASFRISNIWGINKKSRLLSYDFDYDQNRLSEMLLGLFRLLSNVIIVTADKTDVAWELVPTFKEGYGAI